VQTAANPKNTLKIMPNTETASRKRKPRTGISRKRERNRPLLVKADIKNPHETEFCNRILNKAELSGSNAGLA